MTAARFQSFDDASDRGKTPARVAELRAELGRLGLAGFIVPRADCHQNEYVPPSDERLAWLTGFSGSAGAAIVLLDRAALFIDGRYTLQAVDQVDGTIFAVVNIAETSPESWLEQNSTAGQKVGYDSWLHTVEAAERLAKACSASGASLLPVAANPLDAVWRDRPPAPRGAIVVHDLKFSGEAAALKLERIRAEIGNLKADALAITDPHALAWAFNIRGADVAHTPIALGFAIIPKDGRPALYIDGEKLGPAVRRELEPLAELRAVGAFTPDLRAMGGAKNVIRLDQATAADAIHRLIADSGGRTTRGPDPIAQMKAVKNSTEISGARAAHVRDGAAVSRFLAWIARTAPAGALTEIDAVESLEAFRRDTGMLKDISFPTISGAGPNGAIVHYRVTRKSNRRIAPGELFLIDSGAQYQDGTTDITRTIAIGAPSEEMRDRFTRVLKGHIAIAQAVFPDGTTGAQLDSLARQSLWAVGLDFDHGTGHGVGSYLSVHEGPARISKLGAAALKRGMILSNEPGYYKTNAFGIRIENLVLVTEAPLPVGAEKPLNAFETLTLAPIDLALIAPDLLTDAELGWLNAYHTQVREVLTPLVDPATAEWLRAATGPLARH